MPVLSQNEHQDTTYARLLRSSSQITCQSHFYNETMVLPTSTASVESHRCFHSPKVNDAYCISPIFPQNLKIPPIFFQFVVFGLIYVFCFPPILTMSHLCIMLYTYRTPLGSPIQ